MIRVTFITLIAMLLLASGVFAGLDPSFSEQAVVDTVPFYPGGTYNDAVPKPNDYLRNPVGDYPSRYHEIVPYFEALAAASDRVVLESHGSTHEGRKLYNLFVSSEENISNLQQLRESMNRLADPGQISDKAELDRLVADLPAVAWLGYSIHGDEFSGVDASLQLLYQLAAGTDKRTLEILDKAVIIVDPIQNPDGRERYLSMLQTYKSHVPNYNRRAMQHQGVWPWGRTNHYLFDLNRDWILLTQPETRGKVATIQKWHPQLVVDAHEMGSNATFLFSPPRQPVNSNIAGNVMKWYDVFSRDQASAFDQRGWPYYTGEWNDQWYPGYGSAWPTFFGAVGILYEMAGVDGSFVKQQDDYLLTYHEAVNKQFTSSLANLTTLVNNREAILRDYRDARREIVAMGKKSGLTFLIVPDGDELKTKRFLDRLIGQGIEVHRAPSGFAVGSVKDIYGTEHASKKFPAGTYVVTTAQVNGALVRTALEFDLHLKKDFLEDERRELEKFSETKMYEVSSWSISLAYDMDLYQTTSKITAKLEAVTQIAVASGKLMNPDAQFGFVIEMVGEKTYQMLIRLFAKDLVLFASEKEFTIEGKTFAPGSIVIRKRGNKKGLVDILSQAAEEIGLDIYGVQTGRSTKGSLLGAPTFRLLSRPRVAIVSGDGTSYTSFGSLWFTLDKELELPHSLINLANLGRTTLSQYNVLVLPASWGSLSSRLGKGGKRNIEKWVQAGGTLICTGSSAVWAADTSTGLSEVRLKRQMLDKLAEYDTAVDRERTAEKPPVDTMALWHPEKVQAKKEDDKSEKKSDDKVSKEDDEWQRRFYPRGVIMKAILDKEEWLAFGMKESVPVMVYTSHAFLAKPTVRTVARFADDNELRLSGLLWPEARERWANTVYVTRERKSSGQIILFATDPYSRAYFYGTRKLLINAVLYGPGMGSRFEGPYEQEEQ